jgi:hypothetical protein
MRARKVDANHAEIIDAFRRMGWSVADTSRLGNGFPDLVVAKAMRTVLVEVKDGRKPPSARKLTPDEDRFRRGWKGSYAIVESLDDVEMTVRMLSTG